MKVYSIEVDELPKGCETTSGYCDYYLGGICMAFGAGSDEGCAKVGRRKDCPLAVKGEGFEVGEIVEFHIGGEFWHYVKIIGESEEILGQIVDEEGEPEQEPEMFYYGNLRKVSE